jgi:hypothetical protein
MGDLIRIVSLALALAAAPIAAPLANDEGTPESRTLAARAVISAHLEALGQDDAITAYEHLAPNVREVFPTAAVFLKVVQHHYTPLYHVRYVEFRDGFETGNNIVVPVYVINEDDLTAIAIYGLQQQADGAWRITTCNLAGAPPLGEAPL